LAVVRFAGARRATGLLRFFCLVIASISLTFGLMC
jgi:hypothetical protein